MFTAAFRLSVLRELSREKRSYAMFKRMLAFNTTAVRLLQEEDTCDVKFYYIVNKNQKLFTFRRKKDEQLKSFYERVRKSIELKLNKKKNVSGISLSEICLLNGDTPVDENICHSDAWKDGFVLKVGENKYKVLVNAPTIQTLKLPKRLIEGLPVFPVLECEFCDDLNCDYSWFKRRLPHEKRIKKSLAQPDDDEDLPKSVGGWIPASNDYCYIPTKDDIGRNIKLSCLPLNGNVEGVEAEIESTCVVEEGPGICPFERRHVSTSSITPKSSFRCVSYNILADLYADSDYSRTVLFPYCPPTYLDFDYRKQLLFKELLGYNGDIICLQEVDRSLFKKELKRIMRIKGLDGVFDEKGVEKSGGEGLVCFYRNSKFKLLESTSVVLSEELNSNPLFSKLKNDVSKNNNFYTRFMERKNILQYVLLESVENKGKAIIVGNTHLYFHPDSDHIRLVQAAICVMFLESLISLYKEKHKPLDISPLIFGDFNSCPEFAVYQLMTAGAVDAKCEDWKSNAEEALSDVCVSHSLSLSSACGTPQYTNYTTEFSGCLDYIFYDDVNLVVEEVVALPSHDEVREHTAIPNVAFPSDHLPLVTTLKWKQ